MRTDRTGRLPARILRQGILLALLSSVASGQNKPATPGETSDGKAGPGQARFEELVRQWLDASLRLDPIQATFVGIHDFDDRLGDFSASGFRARGELAQKYLQVLEAIPPTELAPASQADYRVLQGALKVSAKDLLQLESWKRMPSMYVDVPAQAIFLMVARDYAPVENRLKNIISRLQQIPDVVEAAKRNLSNPPRIWTEIAIDSAQGGIEFFATLASGFAGTPAALRQSLDAECRRTADAYREYLTFLKEDLLERSTGDFRAGKETFEFYLRNNYLFNDSSDQLSAMGQLVFDRTRKQLVDIAKLIDSGKDWKQVLGEVKRRHPAPAEMLNEYRKEVTRVRAFLLRKNLIDIPEGEQLQVLETPLFQRSTIPYAQYFSPAPFEKQQTGYFTVTPVDSARSREEQEEQLTGHSYGDIVNTVVHEAYPGHHLQFIHANKSESTVSKVLPSSILTEGWGLYSEEMLSENGYYSPAERLIQLQWTLVRAARVLIDVGLHTGAMSFDGAVQLLTDQVGLDGPGAAAEVRRYTLSPTQPLSYLAGREIIFRIRSEYARKQGKKYQVRNFHSELLRYGSIPPNVIRDLMLQKGLLER